MSSHPMSGSKYQSMKTLKIKIGDILQHDYDPKNPRYVSVVKIAEGQAILSNLKSGLRTSIRMDRIKFGPGHYSIVTDPKLLQLLKEAYASNMGFLSFPDVNVPEEELAYVRENAKYILQLSRYYYKHLQDVLQSLETLNGDMANVITKAKVPLQAISIISQLK
jgi:hypothetical protein